MSLNQSVHASTRRMALEEAADFLMDYGIIRSGTELEQVCEQIKKLGERKKVFRIAVPFNEVDSKASFVELVASKFAALGINCLIDMSVFGGLVLPHGRMTYRYDPNSYQYIYEAELE